VLLSSGDSFPHLIQKPRSQLGFVTYLLNRPRNMHTLTSTYAVCVMSVLWQLYGVCLVAAKTGDIVTKQQCAVITFSTVDLHDVSAEWRLTLRVHRTEWQ
jgi:bacteriorhodopsin